MKEMVCEVCGKRKAAFLVLVEGAKLTACGSCARGGKILHSLEESAQPGTEEEYSKPPVPKSLREEEAPVEDFGRKIRNAREEKGLKREELAKSIHEMESYLEQIEKEKTTPPFAVLRKLEKALEIKLIEKVPVSNVVDKSLLGSKKKEEYTLADALEEE